MGDRSGTGDVIREAIATGEQMSRMLDDAFGFGVQRGGQWTEVWRPPVDLVETAQEFVFRVELPGIDKSDVEIEADQRSLAIRGEKRQTREVDQQRFHRMECGYGRFERRFGLPVDVDPDGVEAKLEDGVLVIRVPKVSTLSSRRVEIQD